MLKSLPDFRAVRSTLIFDNTPESTSLKRQKPKAVLNFLRETRREITYHDGREVAGPASNPTMANEMAAAAPGLTTWGEFGPILRTVVGDSFSGSIPWNRWQMSETGVRLAVFRYSVPRSASHYHIDFCCYQLSKSDPASYPFRDNPAYDGEIYIDPATGAILRITLIANLSDMDPVTASAIAVQYGRMEIGEKSYVCPIRGVAISDVHNLSLQELDGIGIEKHINIVRFFNFHKFGSTARILGADSGPLPQ